jgi:MFS family permease
MNPQSTEISGAALSRGAAETNDCYRKIFIRLLPLLIVCYLFAFVDRTNVAFAKLQFVSKPGFSEAVYGLGSGIFYIGYALFEFPSNLLLVRVGIRKTLLRIMVLWGLCSAATAFIVLPWHYYMARLFLGVFEAGFFPGILFYITLWVPEHRRALPTSVFMISIPLSGLIGGPVSGWIMRSMQGVSGLQGWQWLFLLQGLPTCVLGIIAFFYLDETPKAAKWLTAAEKAVVVRDLAVEVEAKRGRSAARYRDALRSSSFYALAIMAFSIFTGTGGILFWLPTIIQHAGIADVLHIGLLSAVPFLFGVTAQILVARHSDKMGVRKWDVAAASAVAGLGWCLLPSVSWSPALSLVCVTIASIGVFGATPSFWSMPAKVMTGGAVAGGIALISSLGAAASFGSPALVGWLSSVTGSLAAGQYYLGGVMFLGAVAVLIGVREGKITANPK